MSDIEHANRHHWDSRAKEYDTKPWQKKLIETVYGELVQQRDLFGLSKQEGRQEFKLLDYACGPGTVTRALIPYVSHVQGVDVSGGMVDEYNSRSRAAGTEHVASAVQGNLLGDNPYIVPPGSEEKDVDLASDGRFSDFDAVIVGLGFHHFEDWVGSLRKLAQRVKPGGVVGIIDLAPSEEHWKHVTEEMRKMMHKSGFTEEEMKSYMEEAGLVDFKMVWLPEDVTMVLKNDEEVKRKVFFARGKKP
ncbi:uncharacterized protein PV09_00254 [Verruconis gallopava]|uniref:Methyltransferase type 11 domain-containing protein n=1 Tax=Verruconis gallopava TaxID=253628 RepID=A0A0D1Y2T4_9PEZI|nr:uncharacterized protein PV09_00254 [Verruconis gallopava]KIW09356.1 hypothetical protein PV09_00254 [Verruconis gallopava]